MMGTDQHSRPRRDLGAAKIFMTSLAPAADAAFAALRRLAPQSSPVLILGEPGTGRGVMARLLHDHGPDPKSPFVELDAGGLDSLHFIEKAGRGTVFIRELGELAEHLREPLAELLAGGVLTLRVAASGGQDLPEQCAAGRFSERLLKAFDETHVQLAPLRARAADLPDLVERLLAERARSPRVGEAVMGHLVEYDWPGNLAELEQVVDRLCARSTGDIVSAEDLPPQIRWFPGKCRLSSEAEQTTAFDPLDEEFQLQLIADALRRTHRR